ncbi:unnamed protein product [Urochloa decumbens]|uniref:F-box domain-containing protein n=1 Tax=Urochloa decumbens TaxID=240449 RepID=A0ABC8YEJ3_9POAL
MGATMSRRRSPQPAPPPPPQSFASLPENVLAEIFVNLPPHPANLRSVALGSHQFRDVVTNRPFLRRFHARHGDAPPLVGFFLNENIPRFIPTRSGEATPSASDRAAAPAPGAGALEPRDAGWLVLSSRHGRVLLQSPDRLRLLVLDPMACRRLYIDAPLRYRPKYQSTASVICVPGADAGHGDCRSSAFGVVFVCFSNIFQTLIYLYSSETGKWEKVEFQDMAPRAPIDVMRPCVQVGDVMYWHSVFTLVLAFNINTHQLHEIPVPVDLNGDDYVARSNSNVVAPKDGSSLGFVYISLHNLQLWASNFVSGVHVEWIPQRTVRLDTLLPLSGVRMRHVRVIGFDEDENVVYLWTKLGVFGLQLDTMQSKKLLNYCGWMYRVYPYKSFFITADGSGGSDDDIGHCQN